MKRKLYCCSYQVTEDDTFLRNMTLSGIMGKGAMLGNDYLVKTEFGTYIIEKCTKEDIDELKPRTIVIEIMK